MSNASKPLAAYSPSATEARAGSSFAPPRSMSATCQRPVTMRGISRPGASGIRGGRSCMSGRRQRSAINRDVLDRSGIAVEDHLVLEPVDDFVAVVVDIRIADPGIAQRLGLREHERRAQHAAG